MELSNLLRLFRGAAGGLLVMLTSNVSALDIATTVGLQGQVFSGDGERPSQFDSNTAASVAIEFDQSFNNGNTIVTFTPYGRWDSRDDERRHADIRELHVIQVLDDVEILGGISKVFWGVTESAHLVDVINQTDYLEGFDGEDKLGQPMLRVSKSFEQSTLTGFVLPAFRERAFLSQDNPLSLPFPVDDSNARYESGEADDHVDFAIRYSGYIGSVDYGLSLFDGTSRDPDLVPDTEGRVVPFYPLITQYGLDLQLTRGAWLWKLEAIHRRFDSEIETDNNQRVDYSAAIGGFEYSFYGMADGRFDLGVLAEYHHDSRNDSRESRTRVAFQNDLFVGTRLGFTDTAGSEILAGVFVDLDDDSSSFRLEASRRVLSDARLSVEAQSFFDVDPDNLFATFEDSDFVQVSLELFF